MPISNEQLQAIRDKVDALVADKTDADTKTAASNAADTAAKQADAIAAQAKLDESTADAKATATLTDLTHYLESLTAPPDPAPVTP